MKVARRMRTGQVDVNGGRFNPLAPFGGYKRSGIGREFGKYGLDGVLPDRSRFNGDGGHRRACRSVSRACPVPITWRRSAPLALAGRRRGWLAGWTWGIGHASGVVLVAALAILLRDLLPPVESISAWSERLVGAALIAVGLWALRRSARVQPAPHAHGASARPPARPGRARVRCGASATRTPPSCLGVLHGVAGSSHFVGVLPALALPTRAAALTYIVAFGAGTVAAMTGFAAAAGCAGGLLRPHSPVYRAMMASAALLAILVGGWWLVVGS